VSDNLEPQGSALGKKEIIGKGGLIAGSAASIIGSLLVLIGFVLPWASCGNYRLSGLDIVTQSTSSNTTIDGSGMFLCLIPFFAIGMLGIAIITIPATFWKKIPGAFKGIGMALITLLALLSCCPSGLFFTNIQSARNDPGNLGMGGFIQIEYGFWLTVFGIFVTLLGGVLGVGASLAEKTIKEA